MSFLPELGGMRKNKNENKQKYELLQKKIWYLFPERRFLWLLYNEVPLIIQIRHPIYISPVYTYRHATIHRRPFLFLFEFSCREQAANKLHRFQMQVTKKKKVKIMFISLLHMGKNSQTFVRYYFNYFLHWLCNAIVKASDCKNQSRERFSFAWWCLDIWMWRILSTWYSLEATC